MREVYAVRVGHDIQGVPFYIPRSKAMPTHDMPKLWVFRRDAERAMKRWEARGGVEGRSIVRFRLEAMPDA